MAESLYRCESQGHSFTASTLPADGLCPNDRSRLVATDGSAGPGPGTGAGGPAPAGPGAPRRLVRELRVVFGARTVSVAAGTETMLGRDPEYSVHADLFADHGNVSRRHAVLGLDPDGRAWIRDHYSTNLTKVSGQAVAVGGVHDLRHGDLVRLGADVTGTVELIKGVPGA